MNQKSPSFLFTISLSVAFLLMEASLTKSFILHYSRLWDILFTRTYNPLTIYNSLPNRF